MMKKTCSSCGGTGGLAGPCSNCGGTGFVLGWGTSTPSIRPPATVAIAAILWILFGFLTLVLLSWLFWLSPPAAFGFGLDDPMGLINSLLFLANGLMGAGYVFVGIQTLFSRARDTLGNGIGSMIFCVLYIGTALYNLQNPGRFQMILFSINLVFGVIFLVSGILALVGRGEYIRRRAWN